MQVPANGEGRRRGSTALRECLQNAAVLLLAALQGARKKPQDGMIVKADGTHWNPGSGAGYYGYTSGSWSFWG